MSKIDPSYEEVYYKCPNCNICISTRNRFLVHIYSHDNDFGPPPKNQDQAIFHTSAGSILKITQLPNSYEIYTPKILFCPVEDIARRYAFKIQQPRIVLLRQTEADLQEALQKEMTKRKLREKPTRKKYGAFDIDIHEDEILDPDDEDYDDSDDSYEPQEEHLQVEGRARANKQKRYYIPGSILVCVPCNETFVSPVEYAFHVKQAHCKNGIFFCTDCTFQSPLRIAFNKHCRRTCSGVSYKVIKCIQCSPMTDWTYRLSYLKHVYSHRVDGRYACPHCPESTIKVCNIAEHILRMHGDVVAKEERTAKSQTGYTRPRRHYEKKPTELLTCEKCGKSMDKSYMKDHLEVHKRREERNSAKPFMCAVCKEGFSRQENLQRHFSLHLANNPNVCKFPGCGYRSNTRGNLQRHSLLHFSTQTFACDICHVEYSREYRLRQHKKIYHTVNADGTAPKEAPKVPLCRRKPRFRIRRYEAPVLTLPPPTVPRLRDPDDDAPQPEGGINIGSIHLGDEETIKAECRESMMDVMEDLESAAIVKSEEPAEVRQTTGSRARAAVFESLLEEDPLVKRLAVEDPAFVKQLLSSGTKHTNYGDHDAFPCKICVPQVNYPRLYRLLHHMKRFHPEEAAKNSVELASSELMFTCGSCGFQSRTSQQLSRHMKTHNPKKLHCVTCGSRFHKQLQLDAHVQRVHLADKAFKCTKCDKGFANDYFRLRHEKSVHPPPPKNPDDLICKDCGKIARTMKALRTHVQLHSKNRVMSYCKICNEKLSCASSLRRHIRLVHVKAKKDSVDKTNEVTPESELFL